MERAGAERMVYDLVSCLRERYDVRVIAAGGGGALETEFKALGIELSVCPPGVSTYQRLTYLWRELRAHRPDLLHTHVGGDVWAGIVARAQRFHPWITTAHNEDQDDPLVRHVLRRWAARACDHTVCVSEVVKKYTAREFRVPKERLSVIPNGIDLSATKPRLGGTYHDVPRLALIGRLTAQKGQETVLRALALIKRPWKLDVYGDGPDRLRLERLVESVGIMPRVTFHGVVSDLQTRLTQSDLACFPSRWEGQGIALMEAAACGVPILASDLPVFREWFDDRAMRFVTMGDVEAWAAAFREVLAQPQPALKRAALAQSIVQERGSRTAMAEQYANVYDEWLKRYAYLTR